MAHFRGTVKGSAGGTTRLGSKGSGLIAQAYGWDCGATISMHHNNTEIGDYVTISLTNGSTGASRHLFTMKSSDVRKYVDCKINLYLTDITPVNSPEPTALDLVLKDVVEKIRRS